ncbi:hypothetical protein SKAU_G00367650, partial [Synaphobranchus kaupii]
LWRVWRVPRPHLVHELQVGEEGDVLGPLHGAEEQAGGQLADVLDAHQVVGLHALGAVAGRGVRLCPQQQGDEAREISPHVGVSRGLRRGERARKEENTACV